MPSSRHVGHRVGVQVCVAYEAVYYVARVRSPARKQAQSVTTYPRASFVRGRTCLSQGAKGTGEEDGATRTGRREG